jgi:hypothetical protein
MKKEGSTLCFWCGEDHLVWSPKDQAYQTDCPQECKEKNALMIEASKHVETKALRRMLEACGSDSLYTWIVSVIPFVKGER